MATDRHAGNVRGFHNHGAAWYAASMGGTDPMVSIGFYHPQGGSSGEFSIEWIELAGRREPRLQVFDDAWDALQHFGDVLARLAALDVRRPKPWLPPPPPATVEQICKLLLECGLQDLTQRVNPATLAPAGHA